MGIVKTEICSEDGLTACAESLNSLEGLVVDIGGALSLLPRADYVVDLRPYNGNAPTRGSGERRVTESRWIVADICDGLPFFGDKMFDFAYCSQTVEDVRDPIGLIRAMTRIAKAGFISTIHWTYEANASIEGFVGHNHHRWMIGERGGVLEFLYKSPVVQKIDGSGATVIGQMLNVYWIDSLDAREIFYRGGNERREFMEFCQDRWGIK